MKKNLLFSLLVSQLAGVGIATGQQYNPTPLLSPDQQVEKPTRCSFDESIRKAVPNTFGQEKFAIHYKKRLEQLKTLSANNEPIKGKRATYNVPLVIHVIHNGGVGKIKLDQIETAVDELNEVLAGDHPDWDDIDPLFKDVAAKDTDIQVYLATKDPDGNPSEGVTYHYEPNLCGRNTAELSNLAVWDNTMYFEVYIVRDVECNGNANNSGYAFLPKSNMANYNRAMIVFNHRYFGNIGSSWAYDGGNQEFMTRSFVHEFGHWLGLDHTFGNSGSNNTFEGDCGYSDGIDDTPTTTTAWGNECDKSFSPCDVVANVENMMDYDNCERMYTKGQLAVMQAAINSTQDFRRGLWQPSNIAATTTSPSSKQVILDDSEFYERIHNDGVIEDPIEIKLINETFAQSEGSTLNQGSDFTISGLPSGLSATMKVTSSTTAEVSLTGNASGHAASNSTANVSFAIQGGALSGGSTSGVLGTSRKLRVTFSDPHYVKQLEANTSLYKYLVNTGSVWASFPFNYKFLGLWKHEGGLFIETYGNRAICDGESLNITPLEYGTLIGAESNWVKSIGGYPPLGKTHSTDNEEYTAWRGKTAYVGLRLWLVDAFYHGWLKVRVDAGGTQMEVLEMAVSSVKEAPIKAGSYDWVGYDFNTDVKRPVDTDKAVSLFPNPNNGNFKLYITDNSLAGESQLTVMDIQGKVVYQDVLTGMSKGTTYDIQLAHVKPGFYIVSMNTNQGRINRKILIE